MEWWGYLLFLVGGLLLLFSTGLPVAFAFLLVNILGIVLFYGGAGALSILILSIYDSLATFVLAPVPLFILMGEVMFRSKMAYRAIDVIEMWMGKVPGRLGLMAIVCGTLFSSLTGSAMANVALLGSSLTPEMKARGYHKSMSLGTVLGSSGLAMMIPPSSLAVILGSLAFIPIGQMLIAGIVPGLIMGTLYVAYVVVRCALNPSLAPAYPVPHTSLSKKIKAFVKYLLPLGFIIFSVIGVILLGIATPSESAALGVLSTVILALLYGEFTLETLRISLRSAFRVSVMVLIIISGAQAFSQLLSFTGAARGLLEFIIALQVSDFSILLCMMAGLIILGCFMEQVCMMMITIPLYMPIVKALGFNPLWFGVLMLVNLEIAATTPPFGLNLFVMKGVAPMETTMGDIYKAALPFILFDLVALTLIIAFPGIALWLPAKLT